MGRAWDTAHDRSVGSPTSSATVVPPAGATLTMTHAQPAAHDDTAAQDVIRNPLWLIAIGMACLFAVMAAVMSGG